MTTSQPGQNSEDFLRALIKPSAEPTEKVQEPEDDPDEHPQDDPSADERDGDS